jgi:pyridoxine/pyridoxamine 5'-phosphate oxidase
VDGDRGEVPVGWIGHRLEPRTIEFWQEDPDGLHDRLIARRTGDDWTIERFAP